MTKSLCIPGIASSLRRHFYSRAVLRVASSLGLKASSRDSRDSTTLQSTAPDDEQTPLAEVMELRRRAQRTASCSCRLISYRRGYA
jgi:hypothetical protein